MAAFLERLNAARQRQTQSQTQGTGAQVSRWGGLGSSDSIKGYVSRLGRLQGEVRREMGSWLEQLQAPSDSDSGLGLHSQVEDVKRRLNSTLSGLESHLHQALQGHTTAATNTATGTATIAATSTGQSRLGPHPGAARESAASAPAPEKVGGNHTQGVEDSLTRQDASGATAEEEEEDGAEGTGEGEGEAQTQANAQGRSAREGKGAAEQVADRSVPSAHPGPAPVSQRASPPLKFFAALTGSPASTLDPPAAGAASATPGRSPSAGGAAPGEGEAHWRHTGGGSGLSGPLAPSQAGVSFDVSPVSSALEVTRSSSLASLRSAGTRIGKAIVEEEWGGQAPAQGAPSWLLTAEQQRQQEAQMLADWLADR